MKATFLLPLIAAGLMHASPPVAAHEHDAPHASTALADGQVKKINKVAGTVTLTHGPLPNGMPGMTMAFHVKEAAWLEQLREGQKIRFTVAEPGGVLTVMRYEIVK